VQGEFPWALGPDDGRYVLRPGAGQEPTHIVVLRTLGAPQRRLLAGRRPRPAGPPPDPEPVPTARATVIEAGPVDADAARQWLGSEAQSAVEEGLAVLNRVLAAHRVAAADPHVREVSVEGALTVRVGYGTGEQVADGRWSEAVAVAAPRRRRERRVSALRPQERLAALLSGRDATLACEELALRARLDLDAGRAREAALQLRVALEAAIAELEPSGARTADMAERVDELRQQRGPVGEAANQALRGPLSPETADAVEHALARLEAALRARSAPGFG
jgi:hypothetical protein